MLDIKNTILKNKKTCYIFDVTNITDDMLDKIAFALNNGANIIQLNPKNITSIEFLNFSIKVRQLTSLFNALLIIQDRVDIAIMTESDGVFLDKNSADISYVKKIFDSSKLIGSDLTYALNSDYIISNKPYQDKITYIFEDNAQYKAVKR
ncbi:MAG: thiamine phosphate synthase [Candidatus Gastranaerophilales bacterium]|nr:thiamine phosphate synthase [Candidatus Gastranaerophilales bacterium]